MIQDDSLGVVENIGCIMGGPSWGSIMGVEGVPPLGSMLGGPSWGPRSVVEFHHHIHVGALRIHFNEVGVTSMRYWHNIDAILVALNSNTLAIIVMRHLE
jgi:hypothetical protein